jgi:coproporphyrinogen III oxidase
MMTFATSASAIRAHSLVKTLQDRLVQRVLTSLDAERDAQIQNVIWSRASGSFGGGSRTVLQSPHLNAASVNVSQVQYETEEHRPLSSATALSAILHPKHPRLASLHLHISWTEMKKARGYWRLMADLNPSIPNPSMKQRFIDALRESTNHDFELGCAQGDRYFYIPVLNRHRGLVHFYLEEHRSDSVEQDFQLAESFGNSIIQAYGDILESTELNSSSPAECSTQLDYHTLYFFQVLTLDRGTTSGLLVHNENDEGILGSLPARINPTLLASWIEFLTPAKKILVESLIACLHQVENPCEIDTITKRRLANAVRSFYQEYPSELDHQASGYTRPTRSHGEATLDLKSE